MTSKEQKYYKVLAKDLRAPTNTNFSYKEWQTRTFKTEGPLEMCRNGLHLYTSLAYLSAGRFGERVFEAEHIGEYLSDKYKICCKEVKLLKEIKPEEVKDPEWIYNYCYHANHKSKICKNITGSQWSYYYCCDVKDRPEVYKNITDSRWAYRYCRRIKDRPEVYKNITDKKWAYYYCRDIKNRSEVCKNITIFKYWYCFLNRLVNIIK